MYKHIIARENVGGVFCEREVDLSGAGSLTEYLLKAASLFITEPIVKNTDFAIWRL